MSHCIFISDRFVLDNLFAGWLYCLGARLGSAGATTETRPPEFVLSKGTLMRFVLVVLVLVLLTASAFAEPISDGRQTLSASTVPTHYDLTISPDLQNPDLQGTRGDCGRKTGGDDEHCA